MTEALALLSPDMTDAERRLVVAAARGEIADLGGAAIRSAVLRDLLLQSRRGWSLTAAGLRLARAVVSGALDLTDGAVAAPVHFTDVTFEADTSGVGLRADHARFARLGFTECRIAGAVLAEGAHFEAFEHVESEAAGRFVLAGARIHRTLRLDRSAVGDGRNAVDLTGAEVGDGLSAGRAQLRGQVILTRVRLAGELDMRDTSLAGPGTALELRSARMDGSVDLSRAHVDGAIAAADASLAGKLSMQETIVAAAREGPSGVALTNGRFGGDVDLSGARIEGTFNLSAARISGRLAASGAAFHGGSTAIAITQARIAGDCDLREAKFVGAVEAASCDIGGSLDISAARFFGARVAIDVSHARIARDLDASRAMVFGKTDLTRAAIAGNFDASGASFKVERGAALNAHAVQVGGDCRLGSGFRSIGALVFDEATVQGRIALPDSEIVAASLAGEGVPAVAGAFDAHALSFARARAGRLVMPMQAGARSRGIVDLSGADVGVFEDYAEAWPSPADVRKPGSLEHLVLEGFRYGTLVNPGGEAHADGQKVAGGKRARPVWQSRIAWLESQPRETISTGFAPDAWRTLATRLREQGHEASARRIDIDRRRRTWRRASASRGERWRGRMLDVTVRYGHAPGRALVIMAGVAFLLGSVFSVLPPPCARPCAQSPFVAATPAGEVVAFSPWLYAADIVLPGLALGQETDWRIDAGWRGETSGEGGASAAMQPTHPVRAGMPAPGLVLQAVALLGKIAGVLLALLAAAGFAGLLRDET